MARIKDDFPDPLLPVKTVHPAYVPSLRPRSKSSDSKPRIFFNEILLMYILGLFCAHELLRDIVQEM